MSQPTLSGQIRKLEGFLGVSLFERDSRNVALTSAGEAVLEDARLALAHAQAVQDIAQAYRDPLAGEIRLGAISSLGPFLAPDLLCQMQHDAPRLDIRLTEALTAELLVTLRARELDAVLIATPPDGDDLIAEELFDEPFLVGICNDHPLAARESIALSDMEDGTLLLLSEGHCLRDQAVSLCGTKTVDPRVTASSLLTLMRMAALGHGATLVPALAAPMAKGLVLRSAQGENTSRRIRLVARRAFPQKGALEVIAAAARIVTREKGLMRAAETKPQRSEPSTKEA